MIINNKVEYLFSLCLKVQENRNGLIDARIRDDEEEKYKNGPTVFIEFLGHVSVLEIRIYKNGWHAEEYGDDKFEFPLDKYWSTTDMDRFLECEKLLNELIELQKGEI